MRPRIQICTAVLTLAVCRVGPSLAAGLDAPEGYAIDACSGTDSKPQSKLWYLDGSWWCIIDSPEGNCIFELVDKHWRRLETPTLGGHEGRADALWDGKHLIVLMYYEKEASQLFEFEYDHRHRSYRAVGAPVPLAIAPGSETMVIDQDSRRRLWVSYIAGKKVYVAHSEADHSHWNLPGEVVQDSVTKDDISSVIAFGGHSVGVMWTDQKRDEFGFRVRTDRDSLQAWHAEEVVYAGDGHADDHLHLTADRKGRVYAVTKDDRHKLSVHMRAPDGTWTSQEDILQGGDGTRPILLTAEEDHQLVMLYTRWHEGAEIIAYRTSPLGQLQFGPAIPFISVPGVDLNDITATKQALPRGNLVAIADGDHMAWWNGWGPHSGPRTGWELTERVAWPLADAALAFDFDEGNGHEVLDDSPHWARGQLGGPWADDMCEPHWTRGMSGSALSFDGVRDFVTVAASPQLDLTGSLTLEAWVRRASHDTKDTILSKGMPGSRNYQVRIQGDCVEFLREVDEGKNHVMRGTPAFADTLWHHVACVFDADVKQSRIYVDGRLDAAAADSGRAIVNTEPLLIGTRATPKELREWFHGEIDQVRITPAVRYHDAFVPATSFETNGTPILSVTWTPRWPGLDPSASWDVLRSVDGGQLQKLNSEAWHASNWLEASPPAGRLRYRVRGAVAAEHRESDLTVDWPPPAPSVHADAAGLHE